MPLSAGIHLGPYEVLAPIGAGGMGEVYKARDTRLDRMVAIKVSNERFSERFEREAHAVAALNHPHICQLYDVGPNYLVMEFVEGTPLKGPLPLERAVEYAGQILEALDAAHQKGITHRDLKPPNILVTKQGIKLLDFGLARQSSPLKEAGITLTAALTGKDQLLGTLQYMSPEQLQGKEADARSDLFSFGCVLYEMLTGKRAFEGQSAASVIAAILEREPAPLQEAPTLERVVRRSLAKDPDQRFQTARDLGAALDWALEQPATSTATKAKSRVPWAVAALLALVAAVLAVGLWRAKRPVKPTLQPLVRFDVDLGSEVSLGSAILSPDGTRLVYGSQSRLFTRRLDQPMATEMAGTEGASAPFFSADGQWVAFFTPGKLKKVSVQGGAVTTLCNADSGHGGSWGEDGTIIASLTDLSGLSRIPSAGGAPMPVTELTPGERLHRGPQVLPGVRAVLFNAYTSTAGVEGNYIELMSLGDRRRKTLQRGGWARYLPSGHLVYLNGGTLFAVPFDLDRLEVRGAPVPMLEEVSGIDFSRTGTAVYRSGGSGLKTVRWLDRTGKTQPLVEKPGNYSFPRLSPDGNRLALASAGDIWIYEWRQKTMTRLTFDAAGHFSPVWSPDGRYIAFSTPAGMFWTRADGASKPQSLTQSRNWQNPGSFTPDGTRLAFHELNSETGYDLWTVALESDGIGLKAGKPEVFLQTSFDEWHPSFSPDGRWLAYTSNESGMAQVYVRAFPDKGGKWQISNSSGSYPVWSRNGRELFFRTADNQIMVAAYTVKGDSLLAAEPRAWSEKTLAGSAVNYDQYDVARDGQRIAALMPAEGPEAKAHHLIFLLNFFDELRRRVPAGSK